MKFFILYRFVFLVNISCEFTTIPWEVIQMNMIM